MSGEPCLSVYEQWRLLVWMETHPAALAHDIATAHGARTRPVAARRAPVAYALGLAVGTLLMVLRRLW